MARAQALQPLALLLRCPPGSGSSSVLPAALSAKIGIVTCGQPCQSTLASAQKGDGLASARLQAMAGAGALCRAGAAAPLASELSLLPVLARAGAGRLPAARGLASGASAPGPVPPESPASAPPPPPPAPPSLWEKAKPAIVKNFLPLAFATALVAALVWPEPGQWLIGLKVLDGIRIAQVLPITLVFLITGLQLDTRDMRAALAPRNAPAVLYGVAAILALTPLLGFLLRELPLEPREFATGLAVFSVAPTTLGVGVALTAACGGNQAVALLLTVLTNTLAVFTMPPLLQLLLGADGGAVHVDVADLLVKLAATVLVPLAIGKAARELLPAAQSFARSARTALSLTSTSCLAAVVWQTLSAARDLLLAQQPHHLAAMVGAAVAMHGAYLAANYLVVRHLLRPPLREAIAVGIMASQKSAPVAVTVISYLSSNPAQQGLLSLPGVVGQLAQIFIGAALARQLAVVVAKDTEATAPATPQQQQAQQAQQAQQLRADGDKQE